MRSRLALVAASLLAALLLAGCRARRPADEERLRKLLDCPEVHAYLALKTALTPGPHPPEMAAARERALSLLAFASGGASLPAGGALGTAGGLARAALEVGRTAKAFWDLRTVGTKLLAADAPDVALLPRLAPDALPAAWAPRYNAATEHALLLLSFAVLRLHPRMGLPIPPGILLYEAWRTDDRAVAFRGLVPMVRATKAWVYGSNGLCDLAAREGAPLALSAAELSELIAALGGSAVSGRSAATWSAAAEGLIHGASALCYLDRDEEEKARAEMKRLVAAAERAGVPAAETAALRAYLAYRERDRPSVQRALADLRANPRLDADEREKVEELAAHFEKGDDGFVQRFYDTAFLALFFGRLAWEAVAATEIDEAVAASPAGRTFGRWTHGTARVLDALPSAEGVRDRGRRLFGGVRRVAGSLLP